MLPKSVVVVLARGRMGRGVVGVGEEVGVDAGCALTRLVVEAWGCYYVDLLVEQSCWQCSTG